MIEMFWAVRDEIVIFGVSFGFRKFGKSKKITKKILKILGAILRGDKISECVDATGGNGIGIVWKQS
jgi:hypothetical protein